jgi:hypothetical protein
VAAGQGERDVALVRLPRERHVQAGGRCQELREIDLFEISIVPAPANPDTRILSYKSADAAEAHPAFIRQEIELREHKLLSGVFGASTYARPVDPVEREEKRQARELRRRCDRLLLEAALGFDQDLIDKLDL